MKQEAIGEIELDQSVNLTGSCLCGGVRYRLQGKVRPVVNCYCKQCQKTSGHYVAATRIHQDDLLLDEDKTLSWYESSPGHQRGFCNRCGSSLFWNRVSDNQISVMAGTLDAPTHLKTVEGIHEAAANDYFERPIFPK